MAECGLGISDTEIIRADFAMKQLLVEWQRWRSEWAKVVPMVSDYYIFRTKMH